jgi:hypothetical protein
MEEPEGLACVGSAHAPPADLPVLPHLDHLHDDGSLTPPQEARQRNRLPCPKDND